MNPQPQTIASISCFKGHKVFHQTCKCCKSFQADWYDQLNTAGFKDIETKESARSEFGIRFLKRHVMMATPDSFEANISYYQWAREKAHEGRFKSETDKTIWEMHADGKTQQSMEPIVNLKQGHISRKLKDIKNYLVFQTIGSLSLEAYV